eukprot:m.108670 g.108670  ORF g.108670 m.108670 type:complete len:573 (-) comp15873_c0_seq1:164-1882(-)
MPPRRGRAGAGHDAEAVGHASASHVVLMRKLSDIIDALTSVDEEGLFTKSKPALTDLKAKTAASTYSSAQEFWDDLMAVCKAVIDTHSKSKSHILTALLILDAGQRLLEQAKISIDVREAELEVLEQQLHASRCDPVQAEPNFLLPSQEPTPDNDRYASVIAPHSLKKRSWKGLTPVTDWAYGPYMTFGPCYDSSLANITHEDTTLVCNGHEFSEEANAVTATFKPTTYTKSVLSIIRDMRRPDAAVLEDVKLLARLKEQGVIDIVAILDAVIPPGSTGVEAAAPGVAAPSSATQSPAKPATITSTTQSPAGPSSLSSSSSASAGAGAAGSATPATSATRPTQETLRKNVAIIQQAMMEQVKRLASDTPHIVGEQEARIGQELRAGIASALRDLRPRDIVSAQAIRMALGVEAMEDGSPSDSAIDVNERADVVESPARRRAIEGNNNGVVAVAHAGGAGSSSGSGGGSKVVICDHCGSHAPEWPHPTTAVARHLCFGCGLYFAVSQRKRPVIFSPSEAVARAYKQELEDIQARLRETERQRHETEQQQQQNNASEEQQNQQQQDSAEVKMEV